MKKIITTEKYDAAGKLLERTVVREELVEAPPSNLKESESYPWTPTRIQLEAIARYPRTDV